MTDVRLDAFGIARDGNDMATASHDLSTAWTSLQSVLSGSGGMAGPDEASKEWIDSYDNIAKQAGEASEGVATALAAFDSIMGATGQAYKRAELAGALQDSDGGISIPTHEVSLDTSVPTAMGEGWPGALGEFQGWVEEALASMGLHLPLADTDKMGTAVSAWKAYDDQLQSIKSSVAASLAVASSSDIPQWASMSSARSSVVTTLGQMSTAAGAAVEALDALIDQTVTARNEIMDIVKELAIAVGVEVGVSIALSFFTFGASAVVGAAATSATVMRFVVRIAEVIQRLITLSRIPREAIENGVRLFQAVGRGSRFARIAGETFKGMATGVVSQGFSNILVEGKSFSEGWQGALLGGAVGGTIGGGLGLVGRTGREAAATRSTFTHVAVSTGRGAVTGAASGVGGDYVTAKVNGQDFNVIQSLVFGTVGGAAFDGGHGAVEAHHVHAGGGSTGTDLELDSGAASGHGSTEVSADTHVDVDSHAVDASASAVDTASTTQVDVVTRPSTHAAAAGGTAPMAHSSAAGDAVPTAHADAPVASGVGTHGSTTTHTAERPSVVGSQTPVVTGTAHAGSATTHAGGENVVTHVEHVEAGAHDVGSGTHGDAPAPHTEGPVHTDAPAHADDPSMHADAPATHGDADAVNARTDAPATDTDAHAGASAPAEHAPHSDAPARSGAAQAHAGASSAGADAPMRTEADTTVRTPDHAGSSDVQEHGHAASDEGPTTRSHESAPSPRETTARPGSGHFQAPTSTDLHAAERHVVGPAAADVEPRTAAAETTAGQGDGDGSRAPHVDEHAPVHAATAGTAAVTAVAAHPSSFQTDLRPAAAGEAPSTGSSAGRPHGAGSPTGSAPTTAGSAPGPNYPEARVVAESNAYRARLDASIAAEGLSPREFRHLVSQHITDLTSGDIERINRIRDTVGTPTADSVLQKLIPKGIADDIIRQTGSGDPDDWLDVANKGLSGFIAELGQASRAGTGQPATPRSLFRMFGLGYSHTDFDGTGRSPMYAVRFETTNTAGVLRKDMVFQDAGTWFQQADANALSGIDRQTWDQATPAQREALYRGAMQTKQYGKYELRDVESALDRANPFRGNGWAGHSGSYAPEVLGRDLTLRDGAEIWRYMPNGTQEVLARYDLATSRWKVLP